MNTPQDIQSAERKVRITVVLTRDEHAKLIEVACQEGRSKSGQMAYLLRRFLLGRVMDGADHPPTRQPAP